MTVEADIKTALNSLAPGQVFPDVAPAATVAPYITYQQVGGEAVSFLEQTLPSKKNGRFQISVWAATRASAAALVLQCESALITTTAFQASAIGAAVSVYEEDTRLYGALQDFSIWSDR